MTDTEPQPYFDWLDWLLGFGIHLGEKIAALVITGFALTVFFRAKGWRFTNVTDGMPGAVCLGLIVLGVCVVIAFS